MLFFLHIYYASHPIYGLVELSLPQPRFMKDSHSSISLRFVIWNYRFLAQVYLEFRF